MVPFITDMEKTSSVINTPCINILNNIEESVIITDNLGFVSYLNKRAEYFIGMSQNNAAGKPIDAVFPTLSQHLRDLIGQSVKKTLAENKVSRIGSDTFFVGYCSAEKLVTGEIIPLLDEQERIAGTAFIFRDGSTSIKKIVDSSISALLNTFPDPVILIDREGRILSANDAFNKKFCIENEDLYGTSVFNVFPSTIAVVGKNKVDEVLRTKAIGAFETELEKDIYLHTIYPVPSLSEEIEKLLFVSVNMTTLNPSEKELLEKKARYRNLFNNTTNGYAYCRMIYDNGHAVDFIHEVVNQNYKRITGFDTIEGKRMSEVLPEFIQSYPDLLIKFGRIAQHGTSERFEFYMHEKNKWFDITVYSPQKDYVVALFVPLKAIDAGIWEWNINNGKMNWYDELRTLYGLHMYSGETTFKAWRESIVPGDRELTENIIQTAIDKKEKFNVVSHVFKPDGSLRLLLNQGFPELNNDGNINRYMGVSIDITEYKNDDISIQINTDNLNTILTLSTEPVCIIALNGRILDANKEFISNYSKDLITISNENFYKLFSSEVAEYRKSRFELVFNTGEPTYFKDECVKTNYHDNKREKCIYNISAFPCFSKDKIIASIAVFITEINEINKEAETRRQLDIKYQTLITASPDSIITTNLEKVITSISDIGLELYGTNNKTDLIGMPFSTIVYSDNNAIINEIFATTLHEGLIQNKEIILKKKNTSVYSAEISAALIQDENGAPSAYMIIIRDISQRKIIESELFQAKRLISLGEMASGIAHEIYQPINNIGLIIEKIVMESEKDNWASKKSIKINSARIFENILRVQSIIDNIRLFSRSDKSYISSIININKSIRNAIKMVSEKYKNKFIKLNFFPENNNLLVNGNIYRFEEVILNLLKNAADAIEEKKNITQLDYDMNVDIRAFNTIGSVIIIVKDNGIGITENLKENIMNPFFSTKDEGKGTGLGLSICYGIIKEMNGTLKIESTPMKGTSVIITLPNKGHNEKL
ncbi:MAG: PAS domain-containing protein [Chlorobium sp.]|nr:MAG: PAS domain S-box protein [Chlorobium sp.]